MKNVILFLFAALFAFLGLPAFAVAPATLADLTTGISFADVGLAVLAVAALIIAFDVIKRGAKLVIQAVRGF